MQLDSEQLESFIFEYIDKVKSFISADLWQNILFDFTKNEFFVLLFIYRKEKVNMTQIADYVKVPLNTATGIISRLEKRDIVVRMRSPEDKRIVTIELTNEGIQCIKNILQAMTHYGQLFMKCCTMEELQTIFGIAERFFMLLSQENKTVQEEKNDKNTKVRKIQID